MLFNFACTMNQCICYFSVLSNILQKCKAILSNSSKQKSKQSWSSRIASANERWDVKRNFLFDNVLVQQNAILGNCQKCTSNPAVIRCVSCSPILHCCSDCDESIHFYQPLHDRLVSTNGFLQPVAPYVTLSENQLVETSMYPCV